MPFNAAGAAELSLEIFGGLVTEQPASNLPPGVSPDCQDGVFTPGAFSSRPGLAKVFASAFTGSPVPTVTYAKSYVDPTGIIRNLYLDSNGQIWMENVTSSAGTASSLTTLAATGIYAKSITAFGREYIAPSDGLHGADIPLQYDGTNLDRVTQDGPGAAPTVANSVIASVAMAGAGNTLARSSGVVTCRTTSAHNLLVGYQAQITGMTAATVGTSISTIVINNEDNPGIATVTTSAAHGLVPGVYVSITGVSNVAVGGGIPASSIKRTAQTVQCTTTSAHGLSPGAIITITGVTDASFDTTAIVAQVLNTTTFTFAQANSTDATSGSGNVNLNFPIDQAGASPVLYQVLTVPTTTSFTVQLTYSDGTWTNGSVSYGWDGTYFVASVVSSTSFTYKQPGPDATTTQVGTVTPQGQAAPGVHQCRVSFLTRQGYLTRPGPPVSITASGGQYLSVTNLPIGSSNVVARVLQFTGAGGSEFFYLPVAPQIQGQVVATATQINDNTTTSVTLDFSDNTLFAGLGTSQPGNDLAGQIVIEGALGFGFYGSRLITWGQRNIVQNLLNMGFEGGWLSGASTLPLGWTYGGSGGALAAGHFGEGWQITGSNTGSLSQSAYQDAYGAPILTPNTAYTFRCWLKGAAASLTATISSVSASFTSTCTVTTTNNTTGAWVQANFNNKTGASIPTDMLFTIQGTNALVDEMSIIYTANPYLDTILYGSYVNNPEAFDGVSGKFGAADDTRKVMDCGIVRSNLYMLTREPGGRLHQTAENAYTEPAGWTVNEIAANCGLLSAFSLTKSQADDASAGGGEEWLSWMSLSGARIFGGDQAWKISQEIQPNWDSMNAAAYLTTWALNDPVARRIYFGLPISAATAPSQIWHMDYREMDTPADIASRNPIRIGYSGKLVCTDHARKWCPWNIAANGMSLMYRSTSGALSAVVLNGNALTPGTSAGFGNVYTLSNAKLTDDDYGQIFPYYVTYFFTIGDTEQALQLGGFRHMVQYLGANIAGTGTVTITAYVNTLSNPWALTVSRGLVSDPTFDLEWSAANVVGNRIAFKFASNPTA